MRRAEFTSANRAAWELAGPVHARQRLAPLLAEFSQPGHNCLDAVATQLLRDIGLQGKDVAQLSCNNGRELISIANLRAARCVGFDITESFLEQGRALAAAARVACEFVPSDVYDIPARYDESFDLIYISIGTLGWLPDLPGFYRVVRRLLRPGGWLVVYEMHPILTMFEPVEGDPPPTAYSYFREEPFRDEGGLDYYGGSTYDSPPTYWFQHTLSDIISGCLEVGLALHSFREYPHDLSNVFARFEQLTVKPPLSYLLTARLPGGDDCRPGVV